MKFRVLPDTSATAICDGQAAAQGVRVRRGPLQMLLASLDRFVARALQSTLPGGNASRTRVTNSCRPLRRAAGDVVGRCRVGIAWRKVRGMQQLENVGAGGGGWEVGVASFTASIVSRF